MTWWNPATWFRPSASLPEETDDFWYDPITGFVSLGSRVAAGVRVDEARALTYSAVWACTRALSISAVLPIEVFRGDDDVRRERPNHPVAKLWNKRPNPRMTASAFRALMMRWQINSGNAFADISQRGEMWPIHPSRVSIVDDNHDYRSFRYVVRNDDGSYASFEPEEMLHIPSIMSEDGILGKGVVTHARESVGFGLAAEQFGANHFGEGGIPKVVIKRQTPGAIKDDDRQAFRREWKQIYGGPRGDTVAILPAGTEAQTLGLSQEDSQYIETRQFSVEDVARWYGVPPHMIGHLLRSTFNNIEHLGIEFVRYTLRPWQVAVEQEIAHKQLNEKDARDHFVEHDSTDLLRGDSNTFADFLVKLKDSGILGRDEARKRLRMPPASEVDDDFTMRGATPGNDGPPDEPEEDDEDEMDDDAQAVALSWLEEKLGFLATRDAKAARTAADKPGEFVAWLEVWCDPAAVTEHLAGMASYIDAERVAALWAEQTSGDLLAAAGEATARELPGKVQHVTEKQWANRATTFVRENRDEILGNRGGGSAAAA